MTDQDFEELRDHVRGEMTRDEESARGYTEEIGRMLVELKGRSFPGWWLRTVLTRSEEAGIEKGE